MLSAYSDLLHILTVYSKRVFSQVAEAEITLAEVAEIKTDK